MKSIDPVEFVKKVLDSGEVEKRAYPFIQNESNVAILLEMQSTDKKEWKKFVELQGKINDEKFFYPLIEGLQNEYGIKLYTDELRKNLELGEMSKRQSEALGNGLEVLDFYEKMKKEIARVDIWIQNAERGYIYFTEVDNQLYVIKPLQKKEEAAIAREASEIGIGPKLEETKDGWLVEKMVEGFPLSSYEKDAETTASLFGEFLPILHVLNIVYNDDIERHLIIAEENPVLVDYGVSFKAKKEEDFLVDLKNVRNYLGDNGAKKIFAEKYEKSIKELKNLT